MSAAIIVQKTRIIGTNNDVYSAWAVEKSSKPGGNYSTTMTINSVTYGRVGTERLPAELNALPPRTEQRLVAVRKFHDANFAYAYELILAEYPEAAIGTRCMGEIDVYVKE